MPEQVLTAQPCIWMAAGLISYRLCTRDFDCEHCALDVALHGGAGTYGNGAGALHGAAKWVVPDDRLYTASHLWAHAQQYGVWRVGIDAFAAALIGIAESITVDADRSLITPGARLCTIETGLGELALGTPISGRVVDINEGIQEAPELLVTRPYHKGWIAEITAPSNVATSHLLHARKASAGIALDLRRFRRAVAIRLFAEAATTSIEQQDAIDLRNVIAGDGYLELLRQFIH